MKLFILAPHDYLTFWRLVFMIQMFLRKTFFWSPIVRINLLNIFIVDLTLNKIFWDSKNYYRDPSFAVVLEL